jgi:hypothetical protein
LDIAIDAKKKRVQNLEVTMKNSIFFLRQKFFYCFVFLTLIINQQLDAFSELLSQVTKTEKEVARGVVYTHVVMPTLVPISVHILDVDPLHVAIKVATASNQGSGLARTSQIAKQHGALAGVNGSFYRADGTPAGILKVDGVFIGEQKKFSRGALGWKQDGKEVLIEYIMADQDQKVFWENMDYVVGGTPILVKNGEIVTDFSQEKVLQNFIDNRYARTAVGILPNKHWVFVVVDDGGENDEQGVTLPELAELMKGLGCVQALNLSGGKSATMYLQDQVVSSSFGDFCKLGIKLEKEISDALLVIAPETQDKEMISLHESHNE